MASTISSTRRYCRTATIRSSAPRSRAIAVMPVAPPAIMAKAPVTGVIPRRSAMSCPAARLSTSVVAVTRTTGTQSRAMAVEGVELDEGADHDPDDDVGPGQRRPGHDDPPGQRQRPDEAHRQPGEEGRGGDGQGLETGRGREGEDRDDEEVERAGPATVTRPSARRPVWSDRPDRRDETPVTRTAGAFSRRTGRGAGGRLGAGHLQDVVAAAGRTTSRAPRRPRSAAG